MGSNPIGPTTWGVAIKSAELWTFNPCTCGFESRHPDMQFSKEFPEQAGWYKVELAWTEHVVEVYESVTGFRVRKTTYRDDPAAQRAMLVEEFDREHLKWKGPLQI